MKDYLEKKKKKFKEVNRILRRLFPQAVTALKHKNTWELLVATILSAQTTDAVVNKIAIGLFKKYRTLDDYAKANPAKFAIDIKGVNYYKTKAKAIVEDAGIVKKRFGGALPRTMAGMLELKGVARKTANIVLSSGYGIIEGIAVDTHVRRLTKLLGLTAHEDPKKIESDLMQTIPKGKEWKEFPLRLIEYGRKYCSARSHDHKNCPLRKYYLKFKQ